MQIGLVKLMNACILTSGWQLDPLLLEQHTGQEGIWHGNQDAGTITSVGLTPTRPTVLHTMQHHLQCHGRSVAKQW
jgi:hypothetical protein